MDGEEIGGLIIFAILMFCMFLMGQYFSDKISRVDLSLHQCASYAPQTGRLLWNDNNEEVK